MSDPGSAKTHLISRRDVMYTGVTAVAGLASAMAMRAWATADDATARAMPLRGRVRPSGNPDNPFGVDGAVPLDVVVFKGGYSDEYATDGHERLYRRRFPEAKVSHLGTQQIREVVEPKLRAYKPPDLVMNGGGERLPFDQLVSDGDLLDLRVLLEAPSYDDPYRTVRQTLRDSVVQAGRLGSDQEVWGLPYGFEGYGLWYSRRLLNDNGWSEPQTWQQFMELCARIKDSGLAPFTYPGRYPTYMLDPIITLAVRHGGVAVYDNLESDFGAAAWRQDSLRAAADAWQQFVAAGFVLAGSRGFTHRQAQAKWAQGEAVFVPCGSWLENEEKATLTPEFDLGFMPVPALSGSRSPRLVQASPGEHFVVPRYAKNPAGALEYLRMALSARGCQEWTSRTSSPNAVADATVDNAGPGVTALKPYLDDDANLYTCNLEVAHDGFGAATLYPAITDLMHGDATAKQFIARLADAV